MTTLVEDYIESINSTELPEDYRDKDLSPETEFLYRLVIFSNSHHWTLIAATAINRMLDIYYEAVTDYTVRYLTWEGLQEEQRRYLQCLMYGIRAGYLESTKDLATFEHLVFSKLGWTQSDVAIPENLEYQNRFNEDGTVSLRYAHHFDLIQTLLLQMCIRKDMEFDLQDKRLAYERTIRYRELQIDHLRSKLSELEST